eukprot:jgi/Mesvir1/7924/Mv11848-RA.3
MATSLQTHLSRGVATPSTVIGQHRCAPPSRAPISARQLPASVQGASIKRGNSQFAGAALTRRNAVPTSLRKLSLPSAQAVLLDTAAVIKGDRVSRANRDLWSLVQDGAKAHAEAEHGAKAGSMIQRWSREPAAHGKRVWKKIFKMAGDGELLVEITTLEIDDPEATTAKRQIIKSRQVVLTTDVTTPLVLHWGVARNDPGEWVLAPAPVRPKDTKQVSPASVETPFFQFEGCFGDSDECVLLQRVVIHMEDDCVGELMAMHFVVRKADNSYWYKDEANGWQNFNIQFGRGKVEDEADDLMDTIVRAETTGSWWTLMHRYNLCAQLLDGALASKDAHKQVAKLFVWLRFSAIRQLTWQRNYNTKPRELSASQNNLTAKFTQVFMERPDMRDAMRLMLTTLGRGGEGGDGQAIRDEILNIMHRNDIKEVKGLFLEEWHQKLHNNTTPDDITICEAYLAYLRANGDLSKYWGVLKEGGIDRQRLEGFERPIVDEPILWPEKTNNLIRDFENYLRILKKVHAGADLDDCVAVLKDRLSDGAKRAISFVTAKKADANVMPLMEGIVEARQELRAMGMLTSRDLRFVRDLLYLDNALEDLARRTVERATDGTKDLATQMVLAGLVLENLCLSTFHENKELVLCLMDWRRIVASTNNMQDWPLLAKAVVDRLRYVLSTQSDDANVYYQRPAEVIGAKCGCAQWTVSVFAEEVIRGGPGFSLSLLLSRLDPLLRQVADMGNWQVISPQAASGYVKHVTSLQSVQNARYDRPTVLVADRVSGGEEIPYGAVAVLTGSTVDVLSHAAVRARNSSVLFATCYDANVLQSLRAMEGGICTLKVGSGENILFEKSDSVQSTSVEVQKDSQGSKLSMKAPAWSGRYAVPLEEFTPGVVGAKSKNTRALRESLVSGGIPDWIKLPISTAVPFGSFEQVMADPVNEEERGVLTSLIAGIDESSEESLERTLKEVRDFVMTVNAPPALVAELQAGMKKAGMDVPEGERFAKCFTALKGVWASKWNSRAYVSVRNVGLDHAQLRMSVLVQRIIPADYAFVIHTTHPATGDKNEIYAEVVKGLGETLVGNYPGRALSFVARKDALDSPVVKGYPSKSVGLFVKDTYIFRSDSNGEDLEGYAGAGLYESIPVDEPWEDVVNYGDTPLVWDKGFQRDVLSRIAKVGAAVEKALGGVAQDIEGVVKDGQ